MKEGCTVVTIGAADHVPIQFFYWNQARRKVIMQDNHQEDTKILQQVDKKLG